MDHRAKLKRARYHLDTLEASIDEFMDREPYHAVVKYDRSNYGYYAVLDRADPIPTEDWSLIIGDAVHNLRSSLDTLVYALTRRALGRDPVDDELRELQFPIVENLRDFKAEFGRRIPKLGRHEWAEIFWVQPFWFTDPKLTDDPMVSVLAVLRDLSNVDKHRHLVVAATAAVSSTFELVGPGIAPGTTVHGYTGPLEVGTKIGAWRFVDGVTPFRPTDESKVEAKGKLSLEVQFAEDGPGKGMFVLAILRSAANWFEAVLFPPLEAILNRP